MNHEEESEHPVVAALARQAKRGQADFRNRLVFAGLVVAIVVVLSFFGVRGVLGLKELAGRCDDVYAQAKHGAEFSVETATGLSTRFSLASTPVAQIDKENQVALANLKTCCQLLEDGKLSQENFLECQRYGAQLVQLGEEAKQANPRSEEEARDYLEKVARSTQQIAASLGVLANSPVLVQILPPDGSSAPPPAPSAAPSANGGTGGVRPPPKQIGPPGNPVLLH